MEVTARELIDYLYSELSEEGPFTHKGLESVRKYLQVEKNKLADDAE